LNSFVQLGGKQKTKNNKPLNFKEKTISGIAWSAVDSFANQGVHFVVGIILARLLLPREFGLIGMIAIFMAISNIFINSGFTSALIRKKNCTQADYATVFYYNMAMGLLLYTVLFFSAGAIAIFFDEPMLKPITRVLGLDFVIRSFTIIQSVTLTKRIDFKLRARITAIASLISGGVAIVFAYNGYGVWSLIIRVIVLAFINSVLLWTWNRWKPTLEFSIASFKELFAFGSKLLLSNLINAAYKNIFYVIIGKYYSAQDLGFFTRAQLFKQLPVEKLTSIVQRVTYPVLSQMQDSPNALKGAYRRIITSTTFLSFTIMVLMAAVAEPMIISLIGEKWRTSIVYLQMLCFSGMFYPLQDINLTMLQVKGRSDLFLKLEIAKKILAVPTIIIGVMFGIKIMIAGMMVNTVISYYINSYWSGKMVNYSMREQVKDVMPAFLMALFIGITVYITGYFLPLAYFSLLLLQLLIGFSLIIGISELLRLSSYLYIKETALDKIKSIIKARTK
jgi:teichuronic acid exporter